MTVQPTLSLDEELKKQCSSCKKNKLPKEFSPARLGKDGMDSRCKECNSARYAAWYKINRKRAIESARRVQRSKRQFVDSYKITNGCQSCGFKGHPAALDLHHLNRENKVDGVCRLVQSRSLEVIKMEMEKCEILCANCHRIKERMVTLMRTR